MNGVDRLLKEVPEEDRGEIAEKAVREYQWRKQLIEKNESLLNIYITVSNETLDALKEGDVKAKDELEDRVAKLFREVIRGYFRDKDQNLGREILKEK